MRRNGDNLQVYNPVTKKYLLNQPLASIWMLTIQGLPDKGELVTVNLASGGGFQLPGGIVLDAGPGQRLDTLTILGTPTPTRSASARTRSS